jgi:arabinogalactan endo-1,4-beta-galactosidase
LAPGVVSINVVLPVFQVKRAQSKKMATLFYLEPACIARKTGSGWLTTLVEYVWPQQARSQNPLSQFVLKS